MARRIIGGRISDLSGESSNRIEGQMGQSLVDGSAIPEAPTSAAPQNSAGSALCPMSTTNSRTSPGRIYMYLRAGLVELSEACSRAIRKSFEERQDYEGFTWKKVSKETKTFYFSEFKKSFCWDEEIYLEKQICKAWNKKASARYSDMLSDVKKDAKRPKYMEEQTYGWWLVYWDSPEARLKSGKNSKNRRSGINGPAPSTHNGGSITHFKHGERLAIQLKRKAFSREVYVRTYTKKGDGKTFTNQKCKEINETIETKKIQMTQNNEEIDEVQLYYDSVGGMNEKRCVFGLGSLACEYYRRAGSSSAPPGLEVQQTIRDLERRLDEQD